MSDTGARGREREREERRQQRQRETERRRRATQRRKLLKTIGIVVATVVVLAGIGYLLVRANRPGPGEFIADEGRQHVAQGSPIQYQHHPPASGSHYPAPQPWGVYSTEVPEGTWVHNLEHGGVVLLFKCSGDACDQTADQVQAIARSLPSDRFNEVKLVATPYEKMDSSFTLVAWDHEEALASLDAEKVRAFYDAYVDHGPEAVP